MPRGRSALFFEYIKHRIVIVITLVDEYAIVSEIGPIPAFMKNMQNAKFDINVTNPANKGIFVSPTA